MNLNKLNIHQSAFLDMLRGMAAIFVMIHHVKNAFFASYSSLELSYSSNFFIKIFYFFTGFGRLPVLLFFVLSGFFISRSIFKMFVENKWSWQKYLIARFIRLYVVLVPALILTIIWDSASKLMMYNSHSIVMMNFGDGGIQAFLGNLLFLQTIFVSTFGSNYPLWSLSFEFWYYLLFPFILLLIFKKKTTSKVKQVIIFICFLLLFMMLLTHNVSIIKYFAIWLLGVVPIFMPYPKKSKLLSFIQKKSYWISLTLIGFTLIVFRQNFLNTFWGEFFVSCIFSLIIYLTINSSLSDDTQQTQNQSFFVRFSKTTASFSYTLYLVHAPIINFFINIVILSGLNLQWKPSLAHIICHCLISILVIVYAIIVAKFTELKTYKIRIFVDSIIQKKISKGII